MSRNDNEKLQFVKVYIRQRPFTPYEIETKRPCVVHDISSRDITVKWGQNEKKYNFDQVFENRSTQNEIYEVVVYPLIDFVLNGYTCTVFAYGQTGTGKTYTIIGPDVAPNNDFANDPNAGMVPRASVHLFSELRKLNVEHTVRVSFVEIYNEEVRDLLISDSPPLKVYDDPSNKGGTCIKGLTEVVVKNVNDVYELLILGMTERQTASTNLNRHSSRSHTIFTIIVSTREITDKVEVIKTGRLHLIDLAGSENIGRSGATEMRAREAGSINKSLLALGKVIKALALKSQHVPYRESKLTRILQDSLGGKSKTCMIATFAPCNDAFEETVSTLDYAYVARSVVNCPTVNINRHQTKVMKELQDELTKLRHELNAARGSDGFYMTSSSYEKMDFEIKSKRERILILMQQIQQLEKIIKMKQDEFENLNISFEYTKSAYANIAKAIEEEEIKHKQNEYVAQHLNEKATELHDVANNLLNVCEVSSKHEDIFYKKYQTQCNLTVYNANIAKTISSNANNCLNEIRNTSSNFYNNQKLLLEVQQERAQLLKQTNGESLKQIFEVLAKIIANKDNCHLSFDSFFKNTDYSHSSIRSNSNSIVNKCCSIQQQRLKEVKNTVVNIQKIFTEKIAYIKQQTGNCKSFVESELKQDEKDVAEFKDLSDKLKVDCQDRITSLKNRLKHKQKFRNLREQCFEETKLENDEIKNELASIQNTKKIVADLDQMKETSYKHFVEIQKAMHNVEPCLDLIKTASELINKSAALVEETKLACQKEISDHEQETMDYFSEFLDMFSEEIEHYNNEIRNTVYSWIKQLDVIKEVLHNTCQENIPPLQKDMQLFQNTDLRLKNDLKQFIQKSMENFKDLQRNVEYCIHVGDTPMKPTYVYPRIIENGLSQEDLREKFKNNRENSP